jgi:hypothetical protein
MYTFNYPIETELQIQFWSSNHRCNIMKAYVAFSLNEANFLKLTDRAGYKRAWRKRAWSAYSVYVNTPDFTGVPFSELEDNWWIDMPNIEVPSTKFVPLVPVPIPVYVEPVPNPVFTILPIDVTGVEGTTATLTADATGYDTVEWFDGYKSLGLTTSLDVPFLNDNIRHTYKVVFSIADPGYDTIRSVSDSATVVGVSGVPKITLDPVGGNGDEVAGYQLTSIGVEHSSIQWQSQNAYLLWVDILGATASDYLHIAPYNGRYTPIRVQYKNVYGVTTSLEAQVYLAKV